MPPALHPVPVGPAACPDCGAPTRLTTWSQLPLVRHGGYGARLRTTRRWCPCGYGLTAEQTEVRP